MTFLSGPVNIQYGNSANFVVEFLDSNQSLTVPSGATMTVTYTNILNTTQADVVTMTLTNSFFLGTWSSSNASLNLATWLVSSVDNSSISATGQIRVIQRDGN